MSDERKERCETCRFWYRRKDMGPFITMEEALQNPQVIAGKLDADDLILLMNQGECRRYPPQVVVWPGQKGNENCCDERFPHMKPHDWCGEWKPLEE